jgi:hypothetical protein
VIQWNEEQLKGIVSEALLRSLDENTREVLIRDAITYLLTPKEKVNMYSSDRTPLQSTFYYAVEQVAHKVIRELLTQEDGPYWARFRGAVQQAFDKVFADPNSQLTDRLAGAISRAFMAEDR